MQSPLASGVERLFATRSLHPSAAFATAVCSPICIIDHSNQLRFNFRRSATSPCSIRTLGFVSRQNNLAIALLRRNCGFRSMFPSIHLLAKASTLKLRLERFRTSHARVQVNLLLWKIGASEITSIFVIILFKTCTCCGVGWIRKIFAEESTICGAEICFEDD